MLSVGERVDRDEDETYRQLLDAAEYRAVAGAGSR
jgi:hypothetical protein